MIPLPQCYVTSVHGTRVLRGCWELTLVFMLAHEYSELLARVTEVAAPKGDNLSG